MQGLRVTIAHQLLRNKNDLLCGAAVMAVDFNKLGCFSDKSYVDPLDGPICVCDFERALFGWTIDRL